MRSLCLFGLLAIAGCFSPRYENGKLQCSAGPHSCPDGYHCAIDHRCWARNQDPPVTHTGYGVFSAGGGIGASSDQFRATTSFGQPAGKVKDVHSIQLGALAGAVAN